MASVWLAGVLKKTGLMWTDRAQATEVQKPKGRKVTVTEGVSGLWHYHLSREDEPSRGLCGASVMGSRVKMSEWKVPFGAHFPKKPTWCKVCEGLRTDAPEPMTGA